MVAPACGDEVAVGVAVGVDVEVAEGCGVAVGVLVAVGGFVVGGGIGVALGVGVPDCPAAIVTVVEEGGLTAPSLSRTVRRTVNTPVEEYVCEGFRRLRPLAVRPSPKFHINRNPAARSAGLGSVAEP